MIDIRDEQPDDLAAVREVNRRAFNQEQEGRIVDALREHGGSLLSMVAVADSLVVGHIMFSPLTVGPVAGAALGPMAVLPDYQRQGIGSQLVERGLERLRDQGCPFVVVIGHPEFYPRFGFQRAANYGLTCAWDVPPEAFMVAVLTPEMAGSLAGRAEYRSEFSTVEQTMIDAGFFMKRIEQAPEGMRLPGVREICSVSNCISSAPEDWIESWLHNDWGWFNRVTDALSVVRPEHRKDFRLFAYRVYPKKITADGQVPIVVPENVKPEAIGPEFRSLGFDSSNKTMESVLGFECSPLSCNAMAEEIPVNEYCLFATLDEAIAGAERFAREQPEPGDYWVIEVLERRE